MNPWNKRVHPLDDHPIKRLFSSLCTEFDSVLEKNWKRRLVNVFLSSGNLEPIFFEPTGYFMGAKGQKKK